MSWGEVRWRVRIAEKSFREAATGHVHCRTLVAVAERFREVGCSLISSLGLTDPSASGWESIPLVSLKGLQIRAKDDYMCDNKEHFHSEFTPWRPCLLHDVWGLEMYIVYSKETRERWPLLTVETKLKWVGTQGVYMKGFLHWLVRYGLAVPVRPSWAGSRAGSSVS